MIPCRPTGTAAFCYGLTAADNLSYSCNQRGIVSVQCTQSTTMVDDNGVPIPIHPAGICNFTRLCRNNRCTIRCRNIQTAVGFCSTGNRAGTSDKAAADSSTPWNRPTQRAVSGIIYLRAATAAPCSAAAASQPGSKRLYPPFHLLQPSVHISRDRSDRMQPRLSFRLQFPAARQAFLFVA